MKKNYKTKSMRLLVTLSLIACLLVGCGNSKAETQPEVATDETPTVEEATEEVKEEPTAEPETKEDEAVTEETTSEDEIVAEETTAEETDSADPGEVTYITDFTSIDDYMGSLDFETSPSIVIYNETEGYIINMQEDQHYQLNANDVILRNVKKTDDESKYDIAFRGDLETEEVVFPKYQQVIPDYSKWTQEEKFYFKVYEKSGNKLGGVTCYLAPPTEYLTPPTE